jgi:uncharacterized protein (TIGR03067 family)
MRTFTLALACAALALTARAAPAPLPRPETRKTDWQKMAGTWEEAAGAGRRRGRGATGIRLVVAGDRLTFWNGARIASEWRCTLDPAKKPKHLDMKGLGKSARFHLLAIYALEGDTLSICHDNGEGKRPTDLRSPFPMTFKRLKKR